MEQIKTCLAKYISEPCNPEYNYDLAYSYEEEKQYSAAFSYYLRCAEFTKNNVLACEALLRCSFCIHAQKQRDAKELYFIKQAICASPSSPEPYYIASLYFSYRSSNVPEKRMWLDSYMYASLGLNILEAGQLSKFIHPVYCNKTEFYYQKALCAKHLGRLVESQSLFKIVLTQLDSTNPSYEALKNICNELTEPIAKLSSGYSFLRYKTFSEKNYDIQYINNTLN